VIPFLGLTQKRSFVSALRSRGIGRFQVRDHLRLSALYEGERWAFDNGAFGDWRNGKAFDQEKFLDCVAKIYQSELRPIFSVCPDIVACGKESLIYSIEWLGKLPKALTWYLAVQDGMSPEIVREAIRAHEFKGLFIGGTNPWKFETAHLWVALARLQGIPCHFARASTPRKMAFARMVGCDSFDTTQPLWEIKSFNAFLRAHDSGYGINQKEFRW